MTLTPAPGNPPAAHGWNRIDQVDGCAVVTAGGGFTLDGYAELADTLTLADSIANPVVLDLSELTSMAPAALDLLVGQLRHLRDERFIMTCLVGPDDQVRLSLDTTDLDRVCALHPSVDDAVAALQ
jgi:anti-anti-sigma factor